MRSYVRLCVLALTVMLGSCTYSLTKEVWSPPFQMTRMASKDAPVLTPLAVPLDVVILAFFPVWETVFGVFLTEEFREGAAAYNRNQSFRGDDYAGIGRESRPQPASPSESETPITPVRVTEPIAKAEPLHWVAYASSVRDEKTSVITQVWCMPASFSGSSHISGMNVLIPPPELEQAAKSRFEQRGRIVDRLFSHIHDDRSVVVRTIETAYQQAVDQAQSARAASPTLSFPEVKFLILNGSGGVYRSQALPARAGRPTGSAK